METEDKKQIGDFKLYFQQGVTKDGNNAFLKYTANEELKDILKSAIIDEITTFVFSEERDEQDNRIDKTIKRYKVKKVIYSSIYGSFKDLLFIKDFLDKGTYTLNFSSMDRLEDIKNTMRQNLQTLVKTLMGIDVGQEVVFRLKLKE